MWRNLNVAASEWLLIAVRSAITTQESYNACLLHGALLAQLLLRCIATGAMNWNMCDVHWLARRSDDRLTDKEQGHPSERLTKGLLRQGRRRMKQCETKHAGIDKYNIHSDGSSSGNAKLTSPESNTRRYRAWAHVTGCSLCKPPSLVPRLSLAHSLQPSSRAPRLQASFLRPKMFSSLRLHTPLIPLSWPLSLQG